MKVNKIWMNSGGREDLMPSLKEVRRVGNMIKLVDKRVPKTTYTIELDDEEMREIWGIAGSMAFSCEKTGDSGNGKMNERIKLLRYIEKSFYNYIFEHD